MSCNSNILSVKLDKICPIFSIFAAVLAMMFALTSCDKNGTSNGNVAEEDGGAQMKISGDLGETPSVSEKEITFENGIRDAITFVGQGKSVNNLHINSVTDKLKALGISGTAAGYLYIGRKKCNSFCADCFSLCWYKYVTIESIREIEDNILYINPNIVNWNNFKLELANKSDIQMQDIVFPVDEDIDIYGEKDEIIARIYAGEYSFSSEIGKFGGFELKSEYVNN